MERDPHSPPARDEPAILGIDNVPLGVVIAQAGSRILAVSIDMLLLALLQITVLVLVLLATGSLGLGGAWMTALVLLAFFLLQWGYFAAQEIAMDGRTLGKSALGLRVVSRHGGKASTAALVVRNLIRNLDMLFGIPLLLVDPKARRLGDLVAGTLVVHDRSREEIESGILRLPAGWGGRHAAAIESFLARSELMEPERARRIAERLLREIERRSPEMLEGLVPSGDPVFTLRQALGSRGS